jgi:hypothetical protein
MCEVERLHRLTQGCYDLEHIVHNSHTVQATPYTPSQRPWNAVHS